MDEIKLEKLQTGDKVAIISPSAAVVSLFPAPFKLGIKRLKEVFGLEPILFPYVDKLGSTYEERKSDLESAFSNPDIKAVFSTLGGIDQHQLIDILDPQVFIQNPKPFFGYSDNTNLCNFLFRNGIPSFYGPSILVELGECSILNDYTKETLNNVLFNSTKYELKSSDTFSEVGVDWQTQDYENKFREYLPNENHFFDIPSYEKESSLIKGKLWGGCLETVFYILASNKYVPSNDLLKDTILFLETSECVPDSWIVEYCINALGERGFFDLFKAVLIGRPKSWEFDKPNSIEERQNYKTNQRETILNAVRKYNSKIPVIQNLDFGHTSPQAVMPYGGVCEIDLSNEKIWLNY